MKIFFVLLALASSGYLVLCVIRALSGQNKLDKVTGSDEPVKETAQIKPQDDYWVRDLEEWEDKIMNDTNDTGLIL